MDLSSSVVVIARISWQHCCLFSGPLHKVLQASDGDCWLRWLRNPLHTWSFRLCTDLLNSIFRVVALEYEDSSWLKSSACLQCSPLLFCKDKPIAPGLQKKLEQKRAENVGCCRFILGQLLLKCCHRSKLIDSRNFWEDSRHVFSFYVCFNSQILLQNHMRTNNLSEHLPFLQLTVRPWNMIFSLWKMILSFDDWENDAPYFQGLNWVLPSKN